MSSSLRSDDIEAVQEAIEVLDEAGFDVEGLGDARPTGHGVAFELTVAKATRTGAVASAVGNVVQGVSAIADATNDQSDTGEETEGDDKTEPTDVADEVHIDNGGGPDMDELPDPTTSGDPFHGEPDGAREDRSDGAEETDPPTPLTEALATDAGDVPISSKPGVEAYLAEALVDGQREFTGAGIAEHVETNAPWAARTLNQLHEADAAPLAVEREHADDPNRSTVYHVTVDAPVGGDDVVQEDADGDDDAEDVQEESEDEDDAGDPIARETDPAEETGIEDAAEVEDTALFEGGPTTGDVQDLIGEVETLGALADELDISYGAARLLARRAEVIDQFRDDIERMGVGD